MKKSIDTVLENDMDMADLYLTEGKNYNSGMSSFYVDDDDADDDGDDACLNILLKKEILKEVN